MWPVVPCHPLSSDREPAEPRSLFASALPNGQIDAQNVFSLRLDQVQPCARKTALKTPQPSAL